jgi:predicted lipoprotein with Yx(FWY)xxD motif
MPRSRSIISLAVAAVIPALVVAGCGGNDDNSNSSSNSSGGYAAPAKTTPAASAPSGGAGGGKSTVDIGNTSLGRVLVDAKGQTLYLFQKDAGDKSACSGECANDWPPLRASGKPSAGSGVTASKLGTVQRSDGMPQVTYAGHPLYTFEGDQSAGDTTGQGSTAFGAPWYVVSPAGSQITG